ncbi:terminase small subunit [Acinetobacter radioresistens]|uniref:terminase small subunit n=1 Tax=Acinetobacter radioresistens TaxID=40216 RepID=UPI0021D3CEBD|nr:terminase small subunit [Acinetobacter radioresistens]MCU4623952.1 terminase small subunit [Acinetobacter radioresistens]
MSEQYPGAEPLVDDRHELFCHEYLIDLSIKNAAARAGFSERSARQHGWVVFNRPEVKERIAFLREERNRELGLDSYYVLKNLKSIAERCMQAEAVVDREGSPIVQVDEEGNLAAIYKFEHSGANKALELIGKHIGMFVEQKKINVEVDLMSELIDELSEE